MNITIEDKNRKVVIQDLNYKNMNYTDLENLIWTISVFVSGNKKL